MARGKMKPAAASSEPVEGPWELPDGWRWERLGDVGNLLRGVNYAKPQLRSAEDPTAIALLRGNNIQSGRVDDSDLAYVDRACVTPDQFLQAQDIVLTMSSGSISLIGKSAWVPNEREWTTFGAFCGVIRSFGLNSRWLFFFMQTEHYRRYIQDLAKGTNINNLKREHLARLPLPVPPVNVQRQLVGTIEELFAEVDDGETALERARGDLTTWRKALLKAAVTGELTADWRAANPPTETGADLLTRILAERRTRWLADPRNRGKHYVEPPGPDAANLSVLPEGWTWVSLAQITFLSGGITVDAKRRPASPVEVPYLRVANVQRGHLDLRHVKKVTLETSAVEALKLHSGDILLNEGGDRDKIGRGWVFEGQIDNCVHQNHVFKARPANEIISPFWVSGYLNEFGRTFFIDEGKQTTNLASISLTKVSRAPLPIPPWSETQKIMRTLESNRLPDAETGMLEMTETATTLRQSILAAAFRGELVA